MYIMRIKKYITKQQELVFAYIPKNGKNRESPLRKTEMYTLSGLSASDNQFCPLL